MNDSQELFIAKDISSLFYKQKKQREILKKIADYVAVMEVNRKYLPDTIRVSGNDFVDLHAHGDIDKDVKINYRGIPIIRS